MITQIFRRAALAVALLAVAAAPVLAQGLLLPFQQPTALSMGPGQLAIGQGAGGNAAAVTMSGDCTINSSGVITCTKTNGTSIGTAGAATLGTSGGDLCLLNASCSFSGALDSISGHVASSGTAPALTSCGSGSPAIVGDDKDGQVTMGTSATGCTITFNTAYTSAPLCTVSWQATPLASQSYAVSTTALTLTQTSTSGNKVNYHCAAQSGG
jgi:hypothetical protein